jgi:3alpha(or 20beta)-hydroxysteroid dehydrogenase
MTQRLQGKTAIITGGAQGMGAVTAELFVANGANVVIGDILEDKGQALADKLGSQAKFIKLDVTNEENWQQAVKAAESFGPLTTLVNNAGILVFKAIKDMPTSEYANLLNINLVGAYTGIRAVIEPMQKAGGGSIINISSIDGLQAKNSLAAYASSKWGMRGLTKASALELGPHGIRVNTVHPGGIHTAMGNQEDIDDENMNVFYKDQAIPRVGKPIEVARMTLFLATDEASYSTGSEFMVDGGWNAGMRIPFLPTT